MRLITKITATVVSRFEISWDGWVYLFLDGITLRMAPEATTTLVATGTCNARNEANSVPSVVFMTDTELVVESGELRHVFVFAAGIGPVLRRALETVGRA